MFRALTCLVNEHDDWRLIVIAGVVCLLAGVAAISLVRRARTRLREKVQLQAALDNMTQGLCMWSATGKLILCNKRYAEMYDLEPRLVKPGSPLRDMLQHRIDAGTFSGNPDQYIADLVSSIARGKTVTSVREHKGRFVAIVNHTGRRRMAGDA